MSEEVQHSNGYIVRETGVTPKARAMTEDEAGFEELRREYKAHYGRKPTGMTAAEIKKAIAERLQTRAASLAKQIAEQQHALKLKGLAP